MFQLIVFDIIVCGRDSTLSVALVLSPFLPFIGGIGARPGVTVDSIAKRFGTVLRRRREEAGVSQEALAAEAELHRNYVGLLERGKQIPSILVVEKLAKALGTTMSAIIRDVEKESGKK